jgi:predicted negative regulator of RcsB-dependent stress response
MKSTPDTESTAPSASTVADRAQTFVDWTLINSRALTAGGVLVLVAGAAFWFYGRSKQIQAANADKALQTAKQSMNAGNLPLAQTDLQKVYAKYAGTPAGVEAGMLLAELDYDSGKFQDGITVLRKVSGSSAANALEPTIRSLEGDGYSEMGKMSDAGRQYESAADATGYETEKAYQRAKAARAYQAAGTAADSAKALKLWSDMSTDPKAAVVAAEARIRMGELSAKVASK